MIISLDETKQHLNVTDTTDDELITSKIETAEAMIEDMIGLDLEDDFEDGIPATPKEVARQIVAHRYEFRERTVSSRRASTS